MHIERDGNGFIVAIDGDVEALLGWAPGELLGRPSTEFIHPQDQPSAISAWMSMIEHPEHPSAWRGRYRAADGGWVWVETVNTNGLGDPDVGCVQTTMQAVARSDLSIEEQLRAREQLLSRLADALPVGIAHFDAAGTILATNGRLDAIVGRSGAATLEELFGDIAPDDARRLRSAVVATVDEQRSVDDLEIHLERSPGDLVVCSVTMRCLTDDEGDVTGAVATVDDVTERVRMRRLLEHRAAIDVLTSCLNRRAVLEALEALLADVARTGVGIAVVFVDLDGFKEINDTLGHAVGDEVLATVAGRLKATLRPGDRVGRLGGDEFLVVCPGVADAAAAADIGRMVESAVNVADVEGLPVAIRASIGLAHTDGSLDADALIARADTAMYEAKRRRQGAASGR